MKAFIQRKTYVCERNYEYYYAGPDPAVLFIIHFAELYDNHIIYGWPL